MTTVDALLDPQVLGFLLLALIVASVTVRVWLSRARIKRGDCGRCNRALLKVIARDEETEIVRVALRCHWCGWESAGWTFMPKPHAQPLIRKGA